MEVNCKNCKHCKATIPLRRRYQKISKSIKNVKPKWFRRKIEWQAVTIRCDMGLWEKHMGGEFRLQRMIDFRKPPLRMYQAQTCEHFATL